MCPYYEFTCPHCTERITVNETMRETMLVSGCVVCGAEVSRQSFRPDQSPSAERD